jgi:AcrR family transcriptional regulator
MSAASKTRPRTKPPEERREELMNAAQRLFLKHGAGPTTIEQITTGAAVAKGTFYLYFSSKEDVLAALRARFAQELLARIKAAVARNREDDWQGKLTSWAEAGVAGYLDSIQLHDILFYGTPRPPARKGLVKNDIIDHLAGMLQAGVAAGAWSVDDPQFTAMLLFNGLHSAVDHAQANEKRVNRSRLVRRLQQLCLRVVGLRED